MTFVNPNYTIVCKGNLIDVAEPKIMGIVNVTPDSFFAQSRCNTEALLIDAVKKMVDEGADFIDVGACSTRPAGVQPSEDEEISRIDFALEILSNQFPDVFFSVDTYRSKVAEIAVEKYGVSIINDISGGMADKNMFKTVAQLGVVYILSHINGTPQDIISNANYPKGLINEIIEYFAIKIQELKLLGVNDIILDPGFGFSKTVDQNFELLGNLKNLDIFGFPIMVGLSRKSMIWKTLNTTPENALNGTTVANTIALMNGAKILRVHDVKQAREAIELCKKAEHCLK